MTKLNTLAATLAAAVGIAGCATTGQQGNAFSTPAADGQPKAKAVAGITWDDKGCKETLDGASSRGLQARHALAAASGIDGQCVQVTLQGKIKGKEYPLEQHFGRVTSSNCGLLSSAGQTGLGALSTLGAGLLNRATTALPGVAGTAARQEASKARTGVAGTVTEAQQSCAADKAKIGGDLKSAISAWVSAYAKTQGIPSKSVEVTSVGTFDLNALVTSGPKR